MNWGLTGRTVAITGGAGGVGRSIAESFAAAGATVAILDIAESGSNGAAAAEAQILAVTCDIADRSAVDDAFTEIETRLGPVDILVNNAGILSRRSILHDSFEDWDRVLKVNLYGCYHCSRAVAGRMVDRGFGRIINISSIHGSLAKADMGSYCTSKAAIEMFTKQLAVELGPFGVTVNAVAPGTIRTDINIPLYRSERQEDAALQRATLNRIPARRIGEPAEVAGLVVFLASGMASYINGATLHVDGGYLIEGTPRI